MPQSVERNVTRTPDANGSATAPPILPCYGRTTAHVRFFPSIIAGQTPLLTRLFVGAVRFLAFASVLSCASRDRTPPDTIVVAVDSNPRALDPRFATDSLASKIGELVCPGLTGRDPSGRLVAELGDRWDWETPTRLHFHLRAGVVFHDGSPLESQDVAETYRSILDPATGSVYAGAFDEVASIETPSREDVVFVLRSPSAPLLQDLVQPGVMKRGLTKEAQRLPICAGPYRATAFRRDDAVELEAFPRYWGGAPPTAKLVFRIVPDATIRVLEVAHGSVDLVQNDFPPYFLPVLKSEPHVRVETHTGRNVKYLVFNLKHPALKDLRVRRAIGAAIDRDALIHYKLSGLGRPATGVLAPEDPFYSGDVARVTHDVALAEKLLDEAGFPRGANGTRLSLEYKTSTNETAIAVAKLIKHDLGEAGIAVSIRPSEWGTFFGDILNGDFQIYTLTSPAIADPDFHRWLLSSGNIPPAGSTSNRGGYRNEELDALLEAGGAETREVERRAIYAKVQRIVARDLPVFPLWYETIVAAESDRLEGYELSPFASYRGLSSARKRP